MKNGGFGKFFKFGKNESKKYSIKQWSWIKIVDEVTASLEENSPLCSESFNNRNMIVS